MADINEKTKLPLGFIVTLLAILIPSLGWVNAVSSKVESHEATDKVQWSRQADHDERQDGDIKTNTAEIKELRDISKQSAELARQNGELLARLLEREARQAKN